MTWEVAQWDKMGAGQGCGMIKPTWGLLTIRRFFFFFLLWLDISCIKKYMLIIENNEKRRKKEEEEEIPQHPRGQDRLWEP